MRTALSQFTFALIVLKIFTSEFYAIGALFAVYGAAIMLLAIYRRHEGNRQFFSAADESDDELADESDGGRPVAAVRSAVAKKFRTSGNSFALLTLLSLAAYVALLFLLWRLDA